ncbi:hypothetical protein QCA50_000516 [Cerrena zonata]|uniref:Uncharacterized protein n=1 Tax=Cerrena zonata TaxID=2478898 RepID=A0AAW0GQH3_9APHY
MSHSLVIAKYNRLQAEFTTLEEAGMLSEDQMRQVRTRLKAVQGFIDKGNDNESEPYFLKLTNRDVEDLGIGVGVLFLDDSLLADLVSERMKDDHYKTISDSLVKELNDIYAHVNRIEGGARMIFDAVIAAFWKIAEKPHPNDGEESIAVTVLPTFKLTEDGLNVTNSATGYQLEVSGCVDYYLTRYPDIPNHKDFLLRMNTYSGENRIRMALNWSQQQMFLIEAKYDDYFNESIPGAVGQALALSQFLQRDELRFILTDSKSWMFLILRKEQDRTIYYQTQQSQIQLGDRNINDAIPELLLLMDEWLNPLNLEALCQFKSLRLMRSIIIFDEGLWRIPCSGFQCWP